VASRIPVVWSDAHRLHEPDGEIWVGVRTPGTEVAARAEAIREVLVAAGASFVEAVPHDDAAVLAVHSRELLEFLAGAWVAWEDAGLPADPGQDRVVPYIFPVDGLLPPGSLPLEPAAVWARTGFFCFDTMTLIGPGTWEAARAAADVAVTAVGVALGGELCQFSANLSTPAPGGRETGTVPGGAKFVPICPQVKSVAPKVVYACCRPPGHHATRSLYGGSCYLNNAAIAAQHLRDRGVERVALIDVDAHHGNGAQSIFWERPDVFTASVHVDPASGWFPHFLGLAHERGGGGGESANLNLPLPPGTGDALWLGAVREAARAAHNHGAEALVVALGVDAAAVDPESPLQVTAHGYREAGKILGGYGLPTVVVQEGGYDLAAIGGLVLAALEGLEEGMADA
jgi:acetoin utilization deacetylase AcuC-like enzyme